MIRPIMRRISLVAAGFWAICPVQATAGSVDDVCSAIAEQANRDGTAIGELDIYAAPEAITAILPKSMRYLEPKPVKSADIYALLGCSSGSDCAVDMSEDTEDILPDDDDPVWSSLLVDTRPVSKQIFLYTEHGSHDRDDSLVTLEQAPDGAWAKTFESDDAFNDSGFRILIADKRPYVAVPPASAFFVDIGASSQETEQVFLTIEDPTPGQNGRCAIEYNLTPRLTIGDDSNLYEIRPEGSLENTVVRFLDKELEAIARHVSFDQKQGSRVSPDHSFVDPGTSAVELRDIDLFLAASSLSGVRDDAMRQVVSEVMADHWSEIKENIQPVAWESRWFPIGIDGHAYLGLLQDFSETFPTRGPHYFNESLVALFVLEGNALRPIAAYELQNVFRFSGARFQHLDDQMLP